MSEGELTSVPNAGVRLAEPYAGRARFAMGADETAARACSQCAGAALLVRPASFACNPETASTNGLQNPDGTAAATVACRARAELQALGEALRRADVRLCIVEDSPDPGKPDAVFPNNWVSFHADGTIALYPMYAANRRAERREPILQAVIGQLGFAERRRVDLTAEEQDGRFLEGTGSLVLDHCERIAFACRSARTDEGLVRRWAGLLGFEPLLFDACDRAGRPVYHTNVMLSIGSQVAVVCDQAIARHDQARVLGALRAGGREIVSIDLSALEAFAGNVLELRGGAHGRARRVLVMSAGARAALQPRQLGQLRSATDQLITVPVPTIERWGGGSVRCMIAEVPDCARQSPLAVAHTGPP